MLFKFTLGISERFSCLPRDSIHFSIFVASHLVYKSKSIKLFSRYLLVSYLSITYQRVYRSPLERFALFQYHLTRERKAPEKIRNEFYATSQADGFPAYKNMNAHGEITHQLCMAHAQSCFYKVLKHNKRQVVRMAWLYRCP